MQPIIETNCTFTNRDGKEYTANGAIFDPEQGGYLYVGAPTGKNQAGLSGRYVPYGPLTTWRGDRVGTYWAVNTYRNNLGATITSIQATIDGREYYGRYGSDWSQIVHLRPRKTRSK